MGFENFWGFAAKHPDHLAIVDADESKTTEADLLDAVNQLSHGLQALGLTRGDSIAAMLPNSREAMEVWLAMQQMGVYLTPLNFHLVGPEIAYILQDCEAKVFVVHERFADVARLAIQETGFPGSRVYAVGDVEGFGSYAALKAGQPTTLPAERSVGSVMNYTSGTTGRPKGVRRPLPTTPLKETDLGTALRGYNVTPEEQGNVHLLACPWYHTAPMVLASPALHWGHTMIIMDRFQPERALELARESAGSRDVRIAGGADVIQQYLSLGVVDELEIALAPVLFGGGRRLFENLRDPGTRFRIDRVLDGPAATHLRYVRQ